ncbi:MAG: hypothetical protein ACRDEA_16615, partial [Microcystaceae cyanobacterium]
SQESFCKSDIPVFGTTDAHRLTQINHLRASVPTLWEALRDNWRLLRQTSKSDCKGARDALYVNFYLQHIASK